MFPKLLVPKEQLTLTGPSGSDFASEDGKDIGVETFKRDTTLFAERLEVRSFGNSLVRIKRDVVRCLKWLDLGLSLGVCGLMGLAPKSNSVGGPCVPKPSLADPKAHARLKVPNSKGNAPIGVEGT